MDNHSLHEGTLFANRFFDDFTQLVGLRKFPGAKDEFGMDEDIPAGIAGLEGLDFPDLPEPQDDVADFF